jgi:predicted membrane protein
MTYPLGYLYPNEFAQPLVWSPALFTYAFIISGIELLILAFVAYLLGKLKKPHGVRR